MKIINPNVEYWKQDNSFSHIAKCARVCYASDKTTNNVKLCSNLWNSKHYSMFRHSGVYYIIPEKIQINPKAYIGAVIKFIGHNTYVSTNEQAAMEYWDKKYNKYRVLLEIELNKETKNLDSDELLAYYNLNIDECYVMFSSKKLEIEQLTKD